MVLLNAERAAISGHPKEIVAKYKVMVELHDKANPENSPYISRRPDLFVKRVIRGMLPYKKEKGRNAYKRLKVYIGVPEEFKSAKILDIEAKERKDVYEKTITVKELSEGLGYKY